MLLYHGHEKRMVKSQKTIVIPIIRELQVTPPHKSMPWYADNKGAGGGWGGWGLVGTYWPTNRTYREWGVSRDKSRSKPRASSL